LPADEAAALLDWRLAPRMEPDQGGLAHASTPTEGAGRPGTLASPARR
jgi:hypothetical protein